MLICRFPAHREQQIIGAFLIQYVTEWATVLEMLMGDEKFGIIYEPDPAAIPTSKFAITK